MAKKVSRQNKKKMDFRQVLLGSILLKDEVSRWFPILGLLTFMGLIMISNRFKGEKILRQTVEIQDTLKELRSESVTIEAELMSLTRVSEITRKCNEKGLGLEMPEHPPVKIVLED